MYKIAKTQYTLKKNGSKQSQKMVIWLVTIAEAFLEPFL